MSSVFTESNCRERFSAQKGKKCHDQLVVSSWVQDGEMELLFLDLESIALNLSKLGLTF